MAKYDYWITEEGLTIVEGWARDGLTDEKIAQNIGVRRETIYDWKKKFPNFSNALKKGKEVIDREVENALLKSALGYEFVEDGLTKDGDVVPLRKVQHPNTTALIFWLKNRKPDVWKDKQEINQTNTNIEIVIGEEDE